MSFVKVRKPSEDIAELPTTQAEIIEAINDSEVKRDIEVELTLEKNIEGFPDSGSLPAKVRFVHPEALLIVIPPVGATSQAVAENALTSASAKIKSQDGSVPESSNRLISKSFFEGDLGHVLQVENDEVGIRARKFMRINHEVIAKTIIPNERPGREPTEVTFRTVDIGGNGALLSCKKGSGLDVGSFFELHISDRKFPGYGIDYTTVERQPHNNNAAVFEGQIVRSFPHQDKPDNDCFGFEFGFNDPFVEMQMNDQISKYCMEIKLKENQLNAEREKNARLGGKFKKKVNRFK